MGERAIDGWKHMDAPASEPLNPPEGGESIQPTEGGLRVPEAPIIPYIEGDGIGPEVVRGARQVMDRAVAVAYGGRRRLMWLRLVAGAEAKEAYGELLPSDTLDAIRRHVVALKGPLTTPVGGGYRSLNVTLRQTLDLYANVRPISWIPKVPSPLREPSKVDLVIFREATEDVYAGIEWAAGSPEARQLVRFLEGMGIRVAEDAGLGVKPISETASKRLVRKAIAYALQRGRRSVTLMHKGNIMKFTEGAFREWGYEVAAQEFGDKTVSEEDLLREHQGKAPRGKLVVKDRLADNMLQQLLTRPEEYDVIATTNLNGDYISDAAAGLVGGLGVAPGANLGDSLGLFEPIHGSAPKYAGKDMANPTAEILAGGMLLDYIGFDGAADLLRAGVKAAVQAKRVTFDLARHIKGAKAVGTQEFAQRVAEQLGAIPN